MKRFLITALLLTGTLSTSFGQSSAQPSGKSPDIQATLAKYLRYPAPASRANKVAKAYVFFNVNESGKVADVTVLNASSMDMVFIAEIKRVMNELLEQPPVVAGNYVLPIEFLLEGEGKTVQPPEESKSFVQFVSGQNLLGSVVVVGYTRS